MPVATEDTLTSALQTLQKLSQGKRTVFGTPIPWVAEPIFASGFVIAPDLTDPPTRVIIVEYVVPRGYSAVICGLVTGFAGAAIALPGQVQFTIDVNNPNAATTPAIGYTEKDYGLVPFGLGSLSPGDPWPVEFKHDQNETVRIKGATVSAVPTGAGNFLFGALVGFQWPTMGWEG
jgi:hypothetical protein